MACASTSASSPPTTSGATATSSTPGRWWASCPKTAPRTTGAPRRPDPDGILAAVTQSGDLAIIGGGIVGLATALALTEAHPRLRLILLEKEPQLAGHQTGHNSGVIHSGIYYKPGSLKARTCVDGARRMKQFCDTHGTKWEGCGKGSGANGGGGVRGRPPAA